MECLESKHYKYCYLDIRDSTVLLTNKEENYLSIHERLIEDVSVHIYGSDNLKIVGNEVCYSFTINGFYLGNRLDVDDKSVTNRFDLLRFKKIPYVKSGWYRLKERKPFKCQMNKFYIEYK